MQDDWTKMALEATPEAKSEVVKQYRDSVLRSQSPYFMERNPWVGDAIRGVGTGAGFALGGLPGAYLANYGINLAQEQFPKQLGDPTDFTNQLTEVGSELLPVVGGKLIKGAKALRGSQGLKQTLKESFLKRLGIPLKEQEFLSPLDFETKTSALDIAKEAMGEGAHLTPGQLTQSPASLLMEGGAKGGTLARVNAGLQRTYEDQIAKNLKQSSGVVPSITLTPGSIAKIIKNKAKTVAAANFKSFGIRRDAINTLAEGMLPPQQVVAGYKSVTHPKLNGGVEIIQEPIYKTVTAPIKLDFSKQVTQAAIDDLESLTKSSKASPALVKEANTLISILKPFTKGQEFENYKSLDAIRAKLGEFISDEVFGKSTAKVKSLYHAINADVDKVFSQYPDTLGKEWNSYREFSSKYLKARYSNIGNKLISGGWDTQSTEGIIQKALSDDKNFKDLVELTSPRYGRELLLDQMFENARNMSDGGFFAGGMQKFLAKHRDKFKAAASDDPSFVNRLNRFFHKTQLTNRSLGNNSAISEMNRATTTASIGAAGIAEQSKLYLVRAASNIGIELGKHTLGKMLMDKETSEILIRLAGEEAGSFGADLQTRKLIHRAGKLGIELLTPTGTAVAINNKTGKIEEKQNTQTIDTGGLDIFEKR